MADQSEKKPADLVDRVFSDISGWSQKGVFAQKSAAPQNRKSELELALTVLLVDLAGSDQNFETSEYQIIVDGLHRMFGTSALQVKTLVSQASQILKDLRGTSRYGSLLKEHLNENQRLAILEIVNEVIKADGIEDGFETYIKNKISGVLGITLADQKNDKQ